MIIKWGVFFLLLFVSEYSFSQVQNIALNKPVAVSSVKPGFPASNIVDGNISRDSKWEAGNGKAPHIIEIDLKKYFVISEIRLHSGILDKEKKTDEMTQAAGFWSIKNFKIQYWDDANWSDLPASEVHENRLASAIFKYNPTITTFRIRIICDDGEPINIMEVEVMGTEAKNMPAPPTVSSSISSAKIDNSPKSATITVSDKVIGKTMKYVGYNQGYYFPGSNISGWLEYSNVNSLRVWASLNAFAPERSFQVDGSIQNVSEFDKRKDELRLDPEHNSYIKWNELLPLYDQPDSSSTNAMVYSYALSELKRLNIEVILQIGSTDFDSSWSNKWKQWQRYYALAYYSAKAGGVTMFAMQNEPNHRNSGPMKLDQWIGGMQIVSDAIHCAVEDVNKKYGTSMEGKFVGPVTAGNNPEWWAAVAKNIRTDYHGKKIEKDLLQIFSTHSYNSPAAGYTNRINNIRKIIQDNHPAGNALPIVYTEIGRWMNAYLIDKEETMDSPSLFSEWAGIYANNMQNGGYGMWAFKFANTTSSTYPEGIKSGHHFIWQGKRWVEDAHINIAAGKKVTASSNNKTASFITDGKKSTNAAWVSDTTIGEKWLEIDLAKESSIGSAIIYSGSDGGVYTSTDRIRDFKLQYLAGSTWKDIPGALEKENKYAQLFVVFQNPVTARHIRFITNDRGPVRLRELKLYSDSDTKDFQVSYDVSGIQRTGEVVRLFAKGFKNERPLLKTTKPDDGGLDAVSSWDEQSGNYYIWLTQRGNFSYKLNIDLKELNLPANTLVTAETVSSVYYGEVANLLKVSAANKLTISLSPQSVVLLTIPKYPLSARNIDASQDASVKHGATVNNGVAKELTVRLDASTQNNNEVAYAWFDLSQISVEKAQRVLLKINGNTTKQKGEYRFHVYGIPSEKFDQQKLNWDNAPLLDSREALIRKVGQEAFVAGELAFDKVKRDHYLDVTDLVRKHGSKGISFVFVRETRQLGDDEDKNFKINISSTESSAKPALLVFLKQ